MKSLGEDWNPFLKRYQVLCLTARIPQITHSNNLEKGNNKSFTQDWLLPNHSNIKLFLDQIPEFSNTLLSMKQVLRPTKFSESREPQWEGQ